MSQKPRFDWFQTDTLLTLTILKRNVKLEECRVAYTERHLTVRSGEEVFFDSTLSGDVKSDDFQLTCTPSKVEVKMPKVTGGRWSTLIAEAAPPVVSATVSKKNWDAIEKAAEKEEEDEKLEGDAAVNKMFQNIFANATDDVKKAMMKSYQESGGTVLSTNWEDVKAKTVEVQPPECMEYKKYES